MQNALFGGQHAALQRALAARRRAATALAFGLGLGLLPASAANGAHADVTAVSTSGAPGAYQFDVTIKSPDTGCAQYADWWEVVGATGKLLYRRVLFHSHADEQPFTRDGGPVPIQRETVVWVRAHMSTGGYGGAVLKGSVKQGFARAAASAEFAPALERQAPLPAGCAF